MCLQNLPRSQSPAPKKNELKIKPAKGGNAGKDGKERRSEAISLLFLFFAFPSRPLRARRSFPIRARLALIRAKRCDAVDWVQPKRADSAHLAPPCFIAEGQVVTFCYTIYEVYTAKPRWRSVVRGKFSPFFLVNNITIVLETSEKESLLVKRRIKWLLITSTTKGKCFHLKIKVGSGLPCFVSINTKQVS